MSALNEVVISLGALMLLGAVVVVWAYWPTEKRVERAAQAVQRHRRGATVVRVDPVAPDPAAAGPGEEERTEEPSATVEPEPADEPEVRQPSPDDPAWWSLTPPPENWTGFLDEPTPLFSAPGRHRYPDDLDQESFTDTWNRDELLDRIRQIEAQQAGVEAA
jgi:hypothetical protein